MKKFFILLIILIVGVSGAFAQIAFDTMEDSFTTFSSDVAESIPFASTIGLNWSDATVRQFPHFGVGLTVGAVTMPKEAFVDLANSLNFTLPDEINDSNIGVPIPGYSLEGRIGGLILPFDIGIKLGFIPQDTFEDVDVAVDYTLVGFDIRTPIIKQNLLLPSIALSVGYNYLNSGIETSVSGTGLDSFSGTSTGNSLLDAELDKLTFTDPNVRFQMESSVIDFKLQASKTLLILTPYIGMGYAYGWSTAGGGISSSVNYDGSPITADQISVINDAFAAASLGAPELTEDGIVVSSESDGGAFRAFGGLSVNLFVLMLDLNAMYNINTASLGASANVRIAF